MIFFYGNHYKLLLNFWDNVPINIIIHELFIPNDVDTSSFIKKFLWENLLVIYDIEE